MKLASLGVHAGRIEAKSAGADVWGAWVSAEAQRLAEHTLLLSDDELTRLHTHRGPGVSERYIVTRALVRTVLGARLGVAPRDVPIRVSDTGKPLVAAELHFNVSHSGDLVALAVSAQRTIGVDIERRRELQRVERLADRWLTAPERAEFEKLQGAGVTRSDAFLRVWSVKEARLKALGVGISGSATDVTSIEAKSLDKVLASAGPEGPDYVGAVAFV